MIALTGTWQGWKLQKIGKRNAESLLAPDGSAYSPEEILELAQLMLDLDYLQVENKRLARLVDAHAMHLTKAQIATLQDTFDLLAAILPAKRLNRFRSSVLLLRRG